MTLTGCSPDRLDYDGSADRVEGLGPGLRVAMWVRGCRRRCPGCIAPELWDPGRPTPLDEVVAELRGPLRSSPRLTVTGGEPFLQAEALSSLIDGLRRELPVEVLVYSGFLLEELRAGPDPWQQLLARTDILVDGPYREDEPNTMAWRGSDNQRVHLLTTRVEHLAPLSAAPMAEPRPMAVRMLSPLSYRLVGIPRRGDLLALRQILSGRGLEVVNRRE